ncbi:MAG: efflux RND transporter periplasmic adaptor subunit [Desulfomonile sp.]|jgi:membrane fusion protein (multidrug efflux system)
MYKFDINTKLITYMVICLLMAVVDSTQVTASDQLLPPAPLYSRSAPPDVHDSVMRTPLPTSKIVEGAILHPYRSATVATEVSGVIEKFCYEEGDLVPEGHIVVEMSKNRFAANAERAQNRIKSLEIALKSLKRAAKMKQRVLAKGATTQQDFLTAEASVEVKEAELLEAKQLLGLAQMDLKACGVRAPFTGHIDQRHKHVHEAVERLEKLFDIVDVTQLYAVAHVPESALPLFEKGRRAVFVHSSRGEFEGVVSKLGKRIDPKSKTRKVYVLIPNSQAALEMGMSGSLGPSD